MSATSVTERGRAAAEALMVDTCLIEAPTPGTTNDLTGVVTPAWVTIYNGRCKVQATSGHTMGQRADPGQNSVMIDQLHVHLPMATSAGVRTGQRVTITACTLDPDLVGQMWRVRDPAGKSFATARRVAAERIG